MHQDEQQNDSPTIEEAMHRVLHAEHNAYEAIAFCKVQAERKLEEAHKKAQRIALRTDKRISLIHERFQHHVKDEINQLRLSGGEKLQQDVCVKTDKSIIRKVVDHIADNLIDSK